jgi:hypothetical protein
MGCTQVFATAMTLPGSAIVLVAITGKRRKQRLPQV